MTGVFQPAMEQEQWQAREWLAWEAGNIINVAKVRHYHRFREVYPTVMAYYLPQAEAAIGFVNDSLEGRDWLVGDALSIADLGCWGRMVFMAEGGLEIECWPSVKHWSEAIQAMPGYAYPYDLTPKKDRLFEARA